jgi:CheY-like chemotaxis protein
MLVNYYLKGSGFARVFAETGAAALAKLQAEPFEAVIMGMSLPAPDGWAVMAELRAWEDKNRLPRVPVVAMIGHYEPAARRRSLEAGCSAVLVKPFAKAELLALVEEVMLPARS